MFTSQHVKNLINQLNLEQCIANSFKNYHTQGLHYVNLFRDENLTIKLYFIPASTGNNAEGFLVKPHNHAYNFSTEVLYGSIRHVLFEESEGRLEAVDEVWNKHMYEWYKPENERLTYLGKTFMRKASDTIYTKGEGYYVETDEIHSLVTTGEATCLLLHQFRNKVKGGTFLYDQQTDIDFSNTYERFTRQEIASLLYDLKSKL